MRRKSVQRHQNAVRKARAHRSREVLVVGGIELQPEIIAPVEGHDHLEVVQAFLHFRTHAAERLQALHVLRLDPRRSAAAENQHSQRGQKRGRSQANVQAEQKDGGAGHQEEAPDELHQRLGNKLVELVGIVVQARNQVAGLVLVEEHHRKFLQLEEQAVSNVKQNPAPHAPHGSDLDVTGHHAREIHGQHQQGEAQQAARIIEPDIRVNGVRDQDRRHQGRHGTDGDGRHRNDHLGLFAGHQRHEPFDPAAERRWLARAPAGIKRVFHSGWCCAASGRAGHIRAMPPSAAGAFRWPAPLPPSEERSGRNPSRT